MKLVKHENILFYHVAFVTNNELWVIMPLLELGKWSFYMRWTHRFKKEIPDETCNNRHFGVFFHRGENFVGKSTVSVASTKSNEQQCAHYLCCNRCFNIPIFPMR